MTYSFCGEAGHAVVVTPCDIILLLSNSQKGFQMTYRQEYAAAVKWMYERKHRPVTYWRWFVLTNHNTDSESLKLPPLTAHTIFADLVHRGMMLPTIAPDGVEACTINPGTEADWKRVIHPVRQWFWDNGWRICEWIISGLIGAGLGHLV